MNMYAPNRRQASSAVAFLAHGGNARGGALGFSRRPARKSSG
jgi:hypothetical protein